MTRLLLPLAAAALTACSSSSSPADSGNPTDAGGTTDAGGQTVTIQAGGSTLTYSPATVTIHVGDTVQWNFASAGHTVTSGSGCGADNKFCSPGDSNCSAGTISDAGTTYSHTFNTAGTFPYFCATHCVLGMTGTVTVQ